MEAFAQYFAVIEDPRHSGYICHKLEHVLTIVMCAVLCGLDRLEEIVTFQKCSEAYLKKALGIEDLPSKATFSRILSVVDGRAVGQVILKIMQDSMGTDGKAAAADGKAIRSTAEEGHPHSALQILTAYLTENGVVLGQEAIREKTNEIPVFQEMLNFLNIEGKVVTADAMHCQKETCRRIKDQKGDYLLGVKKNQPSLFEDISLYFQDNDLKNQLESAKTVEKNAGRIEKRVCWKISDLSWLEGRENWAGLQAIFAVERTVEQKGKQSQETSYYITSLDTSAKELLEIVREHWKIESLHWMLDVTFSEDKSRFISEDANKTINSFRKYALAVHKNFLSITGEKMTIKASMLACLMDLSRLCKLLGNL